MQWMGAGVGAAALSRISATFAQAGADRLIVVSNGGSEDVPPSMTLINPDTLEVLRTLSASASFAFLATRWASARDIIWGGVPQKIAGISLATGAEVAAVAIESRQNYTELTPDGRHLLADGSYAFTPDRLGETVSVFSVDPLAKVATLAIERRGEEPLEPFMATVSPRGDYLLVENARGAGSESIIDVRDPNSPREAVRFAQDDGLGTNPLTSEITPDGRFGLVICRGSSDVTVIDLDALAIQGRVALPENANPIAATFTPQGDRLFVPLPGRDAVAVVAVPEFEVVAMLPVGTRPLGAVYLEAPVPERQGMLTPLGTALAAGREWPANCPTRAAGWSERTHEGRTTATTSPRRIASASVPA